MHRKFVTQAPRLSETLWVRTTHFVLFLWHPTGSNSCSHLVGLIFRLLFFSFFSRFVCLLTFDEVVRHRLAAIGQFNKWSSVCWANESSVLNRMIPVMATMAMINVGDSDKNEEWPASWQTHQGHPTGGTQWQSFFKKKYIIGQYSPSKRHSVTIFI